MTDLPNTIRASIDPGALEKTTRFFNAGLDDILTELFQNARRAGANTVSVSIGLRDIAVHDDGAGVGDPARLLAFGASGWNAETCALEDPAGMGLFSLSRRGCTIHTKTENGLPWMAELTPEVFQGKTGAKIMPGVREDRGATVIFPASHGGDGEAERAVQRAARYFPVNVRCTKQGVMEGSGFSPVMIEQKDFLEHALYVVAFDGGRIGVVARRYRGRESGPTVNFHGATLSPQTPFVTQQLGNDGFQAIYDLKGGAGIELVLPARKEIVKNEAWTDLQKLGRKAIFQHVASLGRHRLACADWQAARESGVDLPEAEPALAPYAPHAFDDVYADYRAPQAIGDDAALMEIEGDPVHHQCLARAFETAGRRDRLFDPCSGYEGYGWYDSLSRLADVRWVLEKNGSELEFEDLVEGAVDMDGVRFDSVTKGDLGQYLEPDRIAARLSFETVEGPLLTATIETDVLLYGEGYDPEALAVFVRPDPGEAETLTPDVLADLITASYFQPSDDAEANSYESQRRDFEIAAYAKAAAVLLGDEAGLAAFIEGHASERLIWACPRNRKVRIDIHDGKARVRIDPPDAGDRPASGDDSHEDEPG